MTKYHARLVRRLDALLIHDTAPRCRDVLRSAPPHAMYIIREGEERVGRTDDPLLLAQMLLPLLDRERSRHLIEHALPLRSFPAVRVECLARDEEVNGVGLVGPFGAPFEGQGEDARMMPEPPVVRLVARETGTMDARLLTRAETDDGTVEGEADGVGLCEFKGEGRDD